MCEIKHLYIHIPSYTSNGQDEYILRPHSSGRRIQRMHDKLRMHAAL